VIEKSEILKLAKQYGVLANIIEKDYILGWLLAGIYKHPKLAKSWIFKGGTCLKKCYFRDYRFSEDLDFTWQRHDQTDKEQLEAYLIEVVDWVYETCGVIMPKDTIKIEKYKTPRNHDSIQIRVGYKGPLQRQGDYARVKVDVTCEEIVVVKPKKLIVFHDYSDRPKNSISALSYCKEEIFAEKMRALIDRKRPRDLYDVVYFYAHQNSALNSAEVKSIFSQKCVFKKIAIPATPEVRKIFSSANRSEIEKEWHSMSGHQLSELPDFDEYWNKLPTILKNFLD